MALIPINAAVGACVSSYCGKHDLSEKAQFRIIGAISFHLSDHSTKGPALVRTL